MRRRAGTQSLAKRLRALRENNRLLALRYAEAERQAVDFARLYVATRQLRSALTREKVLSIVQEIVCNMIGSEELAVLERAPGAPVLRLVLAMDVDSEPLVEIGLGEGLIGKCARDGEIVIGSDCPERKQYERDLTACIPLQFHGGVTGVIALFKLLPQKRELVPFDRELFELLSEETALALYVSALHESRRGAQGESCT